MITNTTNIQKRNKLESLMAVTVCAKLSCMTPFVKNVIIAENKVQNISSAVGSSPASSASADARSRGRSLRPVYSLSENRTPVKTRLKTYVQISRNSRKKKTDWTASTMPFTMTMSWGKKRAILAIRVSRRRRSSRSMLKLASMPPEPPSWSSIRLMSGTIQVSSTMKSTRMASKTNHRSRMHVSFCLRARKRMSSSLKKTDAKRCSTAVE
mmetsp:Transcript_89343/g.232926  ORF Transcript_89343/g.232926 Transcript_89343/m.232926 type:complete len:211 (+) Transcript_89343:1-633(+)